MGQEKYGMQTFNQSLASLYFHGKITRELALSVSAKPDELMDILQRREGIRVAEKDFKPKSMRKS
jgi:twitching motility protein PilT